jgi:hypothetical protein
MALKKRMLATIDARVRLSEWANLNPLEWRRCDILPTRCGLLRNLTQSSLIGSRLSSAKWVFFNGSQIAVRLGVWEIKFNNRRFIV